MRSSKLKQIGSLLLAFFLVANFGFAQEKKQAQSESPKQVIIIKKEKDGKVITEKIVKDDAELQEIHLDDANHKVIVKEVDVEEGKQIRVTVNPEGTALDLEQNVNVEIEEINGEKHLKVNVVPIDGEEKTFEWKGEGEIPAEIREKLESDGIFIHESGMENLDGENVFFFKGDDTGTFEWNGEAVEGGPFLGVVNALETKVTVVVDEHGEKKTTEKIGSEEDVDGILIGEVVEGSAAAEAGLKKGDILKAIDGRQLSEFSDLVDFMESAEVGQKVGLSFERDGQVEQAEATLQERKGGMGQNVIIERILEDGEHMDKNGNAFFFRTEDGETSKIHTRHKIVIVTRGDKSEDAKEEGEMEFSEDALPEVALKRNLSLQEYNLFPNPSNGNVQLRFKGDALPTEIKITDMNGKQMYRERLNQFDGQYDQNIDLNDLPSGAYIMTIEQNDKVYTEQLILK